MRVLDGPRQLRDGGIVQRGHDRLRGSGAGLSFVFLPEPGDRPEEAYLCRVRPGTYNDSTSSRVRPMAASAASRW